MKKHGVKILLAGLVFLQIYSVSAIYILQEKVTQLRDEIHYLRNWSEEEIGLIYDNVDQKLTEQISLLHEASIQVGELNVDTMTVPVAFTVEPKTVTDTLKVLIDVAGSVLPLEKQGLVYTGSRDFSVEELFEKLHTKVVLEDNGVQQVARQLSLSGLSDKLFPYIWARFSGSSSYSSNGTYRMNGTLTVDYETAEHFGPAPFSDMKYIVQIDGETVEEMDIALNEASSQEGYLKVEIDQVYTLDKGQTLISCVIAVDERGFVYEYPIRHYVAGAESQREPYFEERRIYAPDGTLLYEFGEDNYRKIE